MYRYLKEVSYIKAHIIHTAGPVAQLHVCTCIHVSVAGDLFWCKVRQECIMGRSVQLPIYMYTQWNYQKPNSTHLARFKTSIL